MKSLIEFTNKGFLHPGCSQEVLHVIDTHMQGGWEWGDLKAVQLMFPKVYQQYLKCCRTDNLVKPGRALLLEEDGWKVALLITKKKRNFEDKETIVKNFRECVKDLLRLTPPDIWINSPILGRDDKCFDEFQKVINSELKQELRVWQIFREVNDYVEDK